VVMLGTAYLYVAAIFLPLMTSFRDGLLTGSIVETPVSAVWLWSFWHAGFGLLILRYAHEAACTERRVLSPWREALATLLVVVGLALIGKLGLPYLPSLSADGHHFFSGRAQLIPWCMIAIDFVAAINLFRLPKQTPQQLWLTVGMLAACLDVWFTLYGGDKFSLGWYISKLGSLFTSMAVLISVFADLTMLYRRVFKANVLLTALANQDGLTSLANRRLFDETLDAEWRRAKRHGKFVSLLLVDVDLFKQFNDRFGHLAGDDCLRKVAMVLNESAQRPGDLAARYGGEEFALILPAITALGAMGLAMQIRARLDALAIPHPDMPMGKVTVSIGVATMVPDMQALPEHVIQAADRALYVAKNEGRDRVRHADDFLLTA
jgi:diguanylate cyclase (GGDEF)-like protein